jgi:hypothetical protein
LQIQMAVKTFYMDGKKNGIAALTTLESYQLLFDKDTSCTLKVIVDKLHEKFDVRVLTGSKSGRAARTLLSSQPRPVRDQRQMSFTTFIPTPTSQRSINVGPVPPPNTSRWSTTTKHVTLEYDPVSIGKFPNFAPLDLVIYRVYAAFASTGPYVVRMDPVADKGRTIAHTVVVLEEDVPRLVGQVLNLGRAVQVDSIKTRVESAPGCSA